MEFITISAMNGLIYGLLLFMVSAGLTLIFGMMGVLNFSHASFYMIGAYIGYTVSKYIGFWPGLIVAFIAVSIIGMLVERFMLQRVHAHGHAHELLLTFGLAFVFEELVKLIFGAAAVSYQVPVSLRFSAFDIFGTEYPFYRVFIGSVAILMFAIIFSMLRFTRVGIIVRAAVFRPKMVEALGHRVSRIFTMVFGIGSGLAGLAGAVAGAFYPTSPNMALELGVIVFVVVVVGGLGSLAGAFLASILVGLFTSFAVGLDWSIASVLTALGVHDSIVSWGGVFTLTLSDIAGTMPFLLMLIVLLVRPAGLLGDKEA
jgi:branched-chain amino acid transport system permease protein